VPEFVPNNRLEELLVRAATDPAARPDFYRELLRSTLYVLTPDTPAAETKTTLPKGTRVALVQWQAASGLITPIFSSMGRVEELAQRSGHPEGCLGMEGERLFELLAQSPEAAVLNPGLAYGKELTPTEIRGLADGSIFRGEERVLEKPTRILLGQPAVFPTRLVDALKRLFEQRDGVEAAYIAQVMFEGSDQGPHPVVGLISSNYQKDLEDAGMVAQQTGEQLPVDFVDLGGRPNDAFGQYFFEKTEPFFQRARRKPWWKFF
jgi:hypothetical protein